MFCLYVMLTISYLRAQTIETLSLPTDSSRPLFKQIEIFAMLTVGLYISTVSSFLIYAQVTRVPPRDCGGNKFLSPLLKRNTFCLANNSGALARGTHSHWLFTICIGRPVSPRSRQMVRENSGLVNFAPESRLPLIQISSIYRKTTGKSLKLGRNGTRISDWNIPSGKTGLPFQMFRCFRKFSAGTTQKRHVPYTFQPDFPETFVNGKHATIAYLGTSPYAGRRICSKRPVYSPLLSCVSVLLGILLSKNYRSNNVLIEL